jgi:hypothetical protein
MAAGPVLTLIMGVGLLFGSPVTMWLGTNPCLWRHHDRFLPSYSSDPSPCSNSAGRSRAACRIRATLIASSATS